MKKQEAQEGSPDTAGDAAPLNRKKAYTAPKIIGIEPLEAVAVVCNNQTPGQPSGKPQFGCSTFSS